MKRCPDCGAELRDEARFCPQCMTVLNKKVSPPSYGGKQRWIYIAATLATAALLIGATYLAEYLINGA